MPCLASPLGSRIPAAFAIVLAGLASACGAEDPEGTATNVLPTQGDSEDSSGTSASTTMSSMSLTSTTADTSATDTDTGELPVPVAYRFECVDIQQVGDADGTVFQATLLEDTWNSDIDDYKLNIIFEVVSRDAEASSGEVAIRSGIGTGAADQCAEPTSQSDVISVAYDPSLALWSPNEGDGTCSAAAETGAASSGSYTMTLGPEVIVYIYAQDTDGTTFNCTEDAAQPDAVPVRAVEAQLTTSPDGTTVAGQLTGCLLSAEAEALCSCLGECNPATMNENCADCPDGSVPLRSLLQGINPSQRCTDLMAADAFDLTIAFTASALPTVPTTCGG